MCGHWQALWATDPEGFWLGMYNGEPVSMMSTTVVSPRLCGCGMFIVVPAYRGTHFGALIAMNQAERLNEVVSTSTYLALLCIARMFQVPRHGQARARARVCRHSAAT